MFTLNYYKVLQCLVSYTNQYPYDLNNTSRTLTMSYDTNTQLYKLGYLLKYPTAATLTTSSYGLWMGTGTTPPTINDITMEAPITSGLTVVNSAAINRYVEETRVRYDSTFVVRNDTSNDMTISEFGVFGGVDSSSKTYAGILYEHTVLEEDKRFTIPAGETRLITYSIYVNNPNC